MSFDLFIYNEIIIVQNCKFNSRYDKTVDYWSFGIIAFEIMCGIRPFLHGESPANWCVV